jgi:hypothetical protein
MPVRRTASAASVFWLIFAFVFVAAVGALRIPAVTAFMNEVLAYLPNVIAAIVIFVLAAAIAGAAGGAVAKLLGDTPTGKLVGTIVLALVMNGQRGRVRRDVELGKERAKDWAERGKQRARAEVGNGGRGLAGRPTGSYRAEH